MESAGAGDPHTAEKERARLGAPVTSSHRPLVSVIMPTYNSGRYVSAAVDSILRQSFGDFELLILDDCSTDDTRAIVRGYADARITVFENSSNVGVSASLGRLTRAASGRYIARMDADDISLPGRLEQQLAYMDAHEEVGVCGTWCKGFGSRETDFTPPTADAELRLEMFFDNPIPHPTVMMRTAILRENGLSYDPAFTGAEDYDLWARLSDRCKFAVLPVRLLEYRFHAHQATNQRIGVQREFASLARRKLALALIPDADESELKIHDSLFSKQPHASAEWFRQAGKWAVKLAAANAAQRRYDGGSFRAKLGRLLWNNAEIAAPRTRGLWSTLGRIPISRAAGPGPWQRARFGFRCAAAYVRSN